MVNFLYYNGTLGVVAMGVWMCCCFAVLIRVVWISSNEEDSAHSKEAMDQMGESPMPIPSAPVAELPNLLFRQGISHSVSYRADGSSTGDQIEAVRHEAVSAPVAPRLATLEEVVVEPMDMENATTTDRNPKESRTAELCALQVGEDGLPLVTLEASLGEPCVCAKFADGTTTVLPVHRLPPVWRVLCVGEPKESRTAELLAESKDAIQKLDRTMMVARLEKEKHRYCNSIYRPGEML